MAKIHRNRILKTQQIAGFTILEILLMVIIISISLVAIITTLNNGITFIQKTRERTVAINLAREGVEAMYQIRDTNRHRRAGKKEECRLKIDPLADDGDCSNDPWMGEGNYILTNAVASGQQYFTLNDASGGELNIDDGFNTGVDDQYSLCEGTGNIWAACPGDEPISKEGKYFRQIQGIGLFLKDSTEIGGESIECDNGTTAECGSKSPKEYRFCSQVAYIGKGKGQVELCSSLTNFQKR